MGCMGSDHNFVSKHAGVSDVGEEGGKIRQDYVDPNFERSTRGMIVQQLADRRQAVS